MPHPTTDRGVLTLLLMTVSGTVQAGTPISLAEAYERALDRSAEARLLTSRIREAEANVDRAWALLKPRWTASYTYTHVEPRPPEIAFPDLQRPDVVENCTEGGDPVMCIEALQASLENPIVLDLSQGDTHVVGSRLTWSPLNGRAIPTIENAYDAVEAEEDRAAAQRAQILLGVARAYYAAAATKRAIEAAERSKARTRAQLELVQARAELGATADVVLRTAESGARQAQLDLARAKNAHAQALLALWSVTYSDDRPGVETPPAPAIPATDKTQLLALARTHRKDLAAALTAVTMAERAKDAIWWGMAPVVGVFGGYRYSNVRGIGGRNSQWSVGVTATVQLYDGGVRYGDLVAADARILAALEGRRSLEHRIDSELDRALLRLDGADTAIARAEEALELARMTLDVSRAQFDAGTVRPIELKEANDRVLDADFGLISAKADRAIAVLELRHAVGLLTPES